VTTASYRYHHKLRPNTEGTVGANFKLNVANTAVYTSPNLHDYPYAKPSVYSPPVHVAANGLSVAVPPSGGDVAFNFDNIDKNLQLALPMQINITCTGSTPCFTGPAPPAPGSFDWIQNISVGPTGRKVQLEAKTYLIDKQYQLPEGTELRGTVLGVEQESPPSRMLLDPEIAGLKLKCVVFNSNASQVMSER
jgi:hypothetical protein